MDGCCYSVLRGEDNFMARKIIFWVSTGVIAAFMCFAAFSYLSGNPQAVQGFAGVGYPQQLRIILGIVKPLGAIALLVPGYPKLKEWAYAGFTFAWICAIVAHYLANEKPKALFAVVLLVLLFVSYVTRPANRMWRPNSIAC
jgi:DoxX-like family